MSSRTFDGVNKLPLAMRVLITLAAFVVVVAGMSAAQSILVPFLLSVFIAVISAPLLSWLQGQGFPRWGALLVVLLLIVLIGLVLATLLGTSLANFRDDLPQYQAGLKTVMDSGVLWLNTHGVDLPTSSWLDIFNPAKAVDLAARLLTGVGGVLTNALLIILTVVFILLEAWTFPAKFRAAVSDPEATMGQFELFLTNLKRYMAIKTLISLITGVVIALWLTFLDIDYAVLWGLLAFLLNYIPTIGSIIAAVPVVLLALVQQGPGTALAVAIGFLFVNITMGNIVEPRTMGRGLGLSPLIVFLSLLFWGWVLGPVGMLLSAPLTMTLKIALDSSEETQWLAILLGPPVHAAALPDEESA